MATFQPFPSATDVSDIKVLLVGAGGLGCELLKILILQGFQHIHVVDLDTIDVTNLNRQFLFRKRHVGQPKSTIACETLQRYRPSSNIKLFPHHKNIKTFPVKFFEEFDFVINALDNHDARRYVNNICVALGKPLYESATGGMFGHTTIIYGGVSECYECKPKAEPTTFPVCTIRTTPSKPIHCIIWAKDYLFSQMFGGGLEQAEDEENSVMVKDVNTNAKEQARIDEEEQENRELLRLLHDEKQFAEHLFKKVFEKDVKSLAEIDDIWKERSPPTPLVWDDLLKNSTFRHMYENGPSSGTAQNGKLDNKVEMDHKIWSLQENFDTFCESIQILCRKKVPQANGDVGVSAGKAVPLTFSKDDPESVDFVTATANLRAHIFNIPLQSRFDIKQISGRIIPIVATTNTIISGLGILNALKVLRNTIRIAPRPQNIQNGGDTEMTIQKPTIHISESIKQEDIGTVHLTGKKGTMLMKEKTEAPNPRCGVCSAIPFIVKFKPYGIPAQCPTLGQLFTRVLYDTLKIDRDEEICLTEGGRILYDPDLDDNLAKTLESLKIGDGSSLKIVFEMEEDRRSLILLTAEGSHDQSETFIVENQDSFHRLERDARIQVGLAGVKRDAPETPSENAMTGVVSSPTAPSKKLKSLGEDIILIDEDDTAILLD